MNTTGVRAGLATRLAPLEAAYGLRVHATTPAQVWPPAIVIGMPGIEFDTGNPCIDTYRVPVAVILAAPVVGEEATQRSLDELVDAVVAALQADHGEPLPEPIRALSVDRADFGTFTTGGSVDYPAYTIQAVAYA